MYFLNITSQLLKRHSPFAKLDQVDEWSLHLSKSKIIADNTLKNPYRLQTVTFKLL